MLKLEMEAAVGPVKRRVTMCPASGCSVEKREASSEGEEGETRPTGEQRM